MSEWDGGWRCNFQASRGGSRAIPSEASSASRHGSGAGTTKSCINKSSKREFLYNSRWWGQNILQCTGSYMGWARTRLESSGESVILTIFVLQGVPSQDWPAASRQTHLQPASLVWRPRERLYVQESTLRGWGGHSLSWERCWGEGRLMHLGVGQGLGRWILLFFLSSAPLLETHRKALKQDVVCSTASFRRVKSFRREGTKGQDFRLHGAFKWECLYDPGHWAIGECVLVRGIRWEEQNGCTGLCGNFLTSDDKNYLT